MKFSIWATAIFFALAGSAQAQTGSKLCHHAGLTYSPGSMIKFGRALQKCALTSDGRSVWSLETAEDNAVASANCVSGGREFGHGSILSSGGSERKCSNGAWTRP